MLMKIFHIMEQVREVLNLAHQLLDRMDTGKSGDPKLPTGGK